MNVVRALRAAGHDVAATRRPHGNTLFARRLGAELVHADLDDAEALEAAMRGREVVFMCAGHYPRYSLNVDTEVETARARVRRTLEAARRAGVSRYVLTSTVAPVGPPRGGRQLSEEDDPVEPSALRCVYHSVKVAIEEEALAAQGLDVVVLCPTAIFGELDVKAGTGFLIVAAGNGVLPFYVEGKTNVVDADDLAYAHLCAAERGRSGERYIIGGHNLMVGELVDDVAFTLGVRLQTQRLPARLAGLIASFGEMRALALGNGKRPLMSRELVDVVRYGRWVSTRKANDHLELPDPTPLQETLSKACDWYARHRYFRLDPNPGAHHAQRNPRSHSARHRNDHPAHSSGPTRRHSAH